VVMEMNNHRPEEVTEMNTCTVDCWFEPERIETHDDLPCRVVHPAYYWTQFEPDGPRYVAADLGRLRQKCEDALGRFVNLYVEEG